MLQRWMALLSFWSLFRAFLATGDTPPMRSRYFVLAAAAYVLMYVVSVNVA